MNFKLIFAGLALSLITISCGSHTEEKHEEFSFLATSTIQVDTFVTQQYVCQINAIRHIEIRSQERGFLQNIYVDEGQTVKKGQPLYQIMPNLYNVEFQRAKAEVDAAKLDVQNVSLLASKNVVAPNELAMAKVKLSKAQAEMALAETHLQFTKINAPFDGIVNRLELKLGSLVEEGDLLTSLSDNSSMWVYFNLPEAEYLNYKMNVTKQNLNEVELLMANNLFYPYKGKVETIEADFNSETGNIAFRASFPNPEKLLRNGETGNIIMKIPVKNAIIIPQKATVEILDKKYVYIIDNNKKVHLKQITVAAEMPNIFIVSKGLKAGDKILLEGLTKVKNKQIIHYTYSQPKEVLSTLQLDAE